jgi:germination protein M
VFKRKYAWFLWGLLILLYAACAVGKDIPAPLPLDTAAERLPILVESEITTATVYYATLNKQYLLPLNLTINATKEVARVAMEKLLAGPPTAAAAPLLPQDTKLLDLYSNRSTVYVNVTKEILNVDLHQAQLAVDSILCTILPLAEGYSLQLLIEGQLYDRLGSVDISSPLSRPIPGINLDTASRERWRLWMEEEALYAGVPLTYYLADAQAMYLVPQTLLFFPQEKQGTEQEIQEERLSPTAYARAVLIAMLEADEQESGLWSPFWPGTELLNLWLEDNIAYVDFSAQLTDYGGGAATESMMLNCLTYSLTALPGISAVQVLIEGRAGNLPEGMDISKPLMPQAPLNII